MEKRLRLKPFVLPSLYAIFVIGMIALTFFVSEGMRSAGPLEDIPTINETPIINRPNIPVVGNTTRLIRPVTNPNVTIGKTFYDYSSESNDQQNAITYFNNIYTQNQGVAFVLEGNEPFEVVSILDGEVINIREDEVFGKTIEIRHDNNKISIYQSLSEVTVSKGDTVSQGQIIGRSGTNKIGEDLGNHLHFELHVNGVAVNPEEYFDKEIGN